MRSARASFGAIVVECNYIAVPSMSDAEASEAAGQPRSTKARRTCPTCDVTETLAYSTWKRRHGVGKCFPAGTGPDAGLQEFQLVEGAPEGAAEHGVLLQQDVPAAGAAAAAGDPAASPRQTLSDAISLLQSLIDGHAQDQDSPLQGEHALHEETAVSADPDDDSASDRDQAETEDPEDRLHAAALELVSIITGDLGSDDGDDDLLPAHDSDELGGDSPGYRILPFCHTFYLGVLKDFFKAITTTAARAEEFAEMPDEGRLSGADKKVAHERNGFIMLHPSFGRKNKDFTTGKLGSWQCEDMARLIGCFVPLLFRPYGSASGPMPGEGFVLEALGHLRQFWDFHTRRRGFDTPAELEAAAADARQHLLAYGELLEQLPARELCTFNLHLLACRLTQQVLERGLTWQHGELWVERMIGLFKRRIKYRTHSEPEKTMVLDYMLRCSLAKFKLAAAQRPGHQQLWDVAGLKEHKRAAARQPQRRNPLEFDSGSAEQGRLLGRGTKETVPLEDKQRLLQLLPEEQRPTWAARWSSVLLYVHKAAHLPDGSYCTSAAFGKSRTRQGSYVLMGFFYEQSNDVTPLVGHVQRYWRLVLPGADGRTAEQQLRVAICDVLPHQPPCEDPRICEYVLYAKDLPRAERMGMRQVEHDPRRGLIDCMECLHRIDAPLLTARFKLQGQPWMALTPIRFSSGGNRSRALL